MKKLVTHSPISGSKFKKIAAIIIVTIIVSVITVVIFLPRKTNKINTFSCIKNIACPDCNLILISVDSLRADHVGALGYQRDTTPHIDSLASQGILFSNYFTNSYLTPITEASLHTGMYPTSHGLTSFQHYLPEDRKLLAEILKKENFTTSAYITSPEFNDYVSLKKSFSRGFENFNYQKSPFRDVPKLDKIFDNLNKLSKNQFFFWLTVGSVHWPYGRHAPDTYTDPKYSGILKGKSLNWTDTFGNIYNGLYYPEKKKLAVEDFQFINDKYDDGLKYFDNFFGKFIEKLQENKLLDNSIIVLTTEHGEELGEHGFIGHYDIYDSQVHTPLLVFTPKLRMGRKIASMVSTVDVLPTIMDLLGLLSPSQSQGKSLVPLICEIEEEKSREAVYIERNPLWEEAGINPVTDQLKEAGIYNGNSGDKDIAVRTKEWKYILRLSKNILEKISWWSYLTKEHITISAAELYNLKDDPGETKNVIDDFPIVAGGLHVKLENWYKQVNSMTPESVERTKIIQDYF